jgi:hypothetical protein
LATEIGNLTEAPITSITDEVVTKAFPDRAFFAGVFRQYSIARVAPKPFKAQNLFVVPKDGKLTHLSDPQGLKTFSKDNLPAVKDDDAAKQAVRAWRTCRSARARPGEARDSRRQVWPGRGPLSGPLK